MKQSIIAGTCFGLTSGVITTLGLMVGLKSGTESSIAVLGGIFTIAVADALSDALGMHISAEADKNTTHQEVWVATISTFLSKLVMALTFVIPLLLCKDLDTAVWICITWGLLVLALLSFVIARSQGIQPWRVVGEHVTIAAAVMVATDQIGIWVARTFV